MSLDAATPFKEVFGSEPTVIAFAPGRVVLIGEHVDYSDGMVLPFAIDQRIYVAAAATDSGQVEIYSDSLKERASFPVDVEKPAAAGAWENYQRGMVAGLRSEGITVSGAKLWIGGDLAPGSGMSSSAALCVATGLALAELAGKKIVGERVVRLAQQSEHQFAGMPCGLMDQSAVTFCEDGCALLLDCRDLSYESVPFVPEGVGVLVAPSGVKHALVEGAYEKRVKSCHEAVAAISADHPEVKALRDVSWDVLAKYEGRMSDETFRRARHVVRELERVQRVVDALRKSDWETVGARVWETQDSLRDDYEVSCPEIDDMIKLLRAQPGVLGARMVGGGFGGIVLALVKEDQFAATEKMLIEKYYEPRKLPERPFRVRPSKGASVERV